MAENPLRASYLFLKSKQYTYFSYPQLQPATVVFIRDSAPTWIQCIVHDKLASLSLLTSNFHFNLHFSYNHAPDTILKLFQAGPIDVYPMSRQWTTTFHCELPWGRLGDPLPLCSEVGSVYLEKVSESRLPSFRIGLPFFPSPMP